MKATSESMYRLAFLALGGLVSCSAGSVGSNNPSGGGGGGTSAGGAGSGGTNGGTAGGGTASASGGGVGAGATGSGSGSGSAAVVYPPGGPPPEVVPIRRLTNDEYTAAVTGLFPGFTVPPQTFISDTKVFNFLNLSSSQNASQVRMEQYTSAAEIIALGDDQTPQVWTGVAANPTTLTGCDVTVKGEMACAQPYLNDLGKRAYRRPLTAAETAAIWALFQTNPVSTTNPTGNSYQTRLAMAIEGILISPNFLFRPEIGDPTQVIATGIVSVTPWEMATRLSFFINGSTPDATLMASADSGALLQEAEIRAQATRLLAMPASQANLVKMHEEWLGIDTIGSLTKDPVAYPQFTPLLAVEMGEETRAFVQNIMFTQSGTFNDLLLSPYTFADTGIAAFYGVPAPATPWGRVDLNPAQRMGLLTQPSLLATLAKDAVQDLGTSIARGKFVLQQLLCRTVPEPSQALVATFSPLDLTKTARGQATVHESSPVCAGCHGVIDPLGLPFEHYDLIGEWRDTDRTMPIDASGTIADSSGANPVTFSGVPALAQLVAQRTETRGCYLQQWFQFSTGKLVADVDQPFLDWLTADFPPDKKLVDLAVDLVASNSFRQLKEAP